MSFTKIITLTKTYQSPADAFSTMPTLAKIATPEEFKAHNERYNVTWSNVVTGDILTITLTCDDPTGFESLANDPLTLAVNQAREVWKQDNFITETVEYK